MSYSYFIYYFNQKSKNMKKKMYVQPCTSVMKVELNHGLMIGSNQGGGQGPTQPTEESRVFSPWFEEKEPHTDFDYDDYDDYGNTGRI